ncbi:hypothetical protein HZZ13_05540 [Bradyrhizobium sp. CNPSo 4010]|uniref:Uncharacterized protein n=1 Tax=Bradyrhizobium agreste TaxID=2751811 RepID=A0ABS0PJY6_9BRAD|nr:hypothetical protein [Bradyrhizobium agreste]MBH5397256.1 hypothetical protein [Bradyrhizobium agreste]
MRLTIQTFFDRRWHDAAVVTLSDPDKGLTGASSVSYEMPYFYDHGTSGDAVRNLRAYSVAAPVDLEDRAADT